MAERKIKITADEFVRAVVDRNERDFTGYDLSGIVLTGRQELNEYFKKEFIANGSPERPIILRGAYAKGIQASGIWLPYLQAEGADFEQAIFVDAIMFRGNYSRANFTEANLIRANLNSSNLRGANLQKAHCSNAKVSQSILTGADLSGGEFGGASFQCSDLREVDLNEAYLSTADFYRTDLRGSRSLDKTKDLGHAHIEGTVVTQTELLIINAAIADAERRRYEFVDHLDDIRIYDVD